jgi:hypothetical protein
MVTEVPEVALWDSIEPEPPPLLYVIVYFVELLPPLPLADQ